MTNLRKVSPGDPLQIPAPTFNTFVDAARDFKSRQHDTKQHTQPTQANTGIVAVLNEAGVELDRFSVLGIGGVLIKPVDNADEFQQRVMLRGVLPTAQDSARFVVLLEPAAKTAIVRGCIDGVVTVRVEMESEDHRFADVKAGVATKLHSSGVGTTQLLWVEPVEDRTDPAVAWAVARLGGGGTGGVASAAFARITSKSGMEPPYRYAAAQGTMDADGNWSTVGGGEVYNNVFNLEEQGAGGQWVNPLVVGDVVLIFAAPDPTVDAFICTRSHYRGTY